MYSIQALWTAAQRKLPLTIIVINNSGYGAMRSFSQVMQVRNVPGLELPGIDFVRLAEGMGCHAVRVSKAAELGEALKRGMALKARASSRSSWIRRCRCCTGRNIRNVRYIQTSSGEGRDPYREIYRLRALLIPNNQSSPNYSLGLWRPAFASGTTANFGYDRTKSRRQESPIGRQHMPDDIGRGVGR